MKTLIASALIASAALAGAASAQVPGGAAGAIAHFNQDFSTQDQRISFGAPSNGKAVVSSRGSLVSANTPGARVTVTVKSEAPSRSDVIFDRIREEGLDDD
ncbi:MAG: hypothetical protein AAFY65_00975 [Pseudomonadota bacterium]